MAAQKIDNKLILESAKPSSDQVSGTKWIDVITGMANSSYVNNSKDNWFKTTGNTIKVTSSDTATTEMVVDVAKAVKQITLGESKSTVFLDGVVTTIDNTDILAGILRVMGFYDSDKITVQQYAKNLYESIDFSKCDRLSSEEIRGLISYLNGKAKILIEKDTINDLYNQFITLGVNRSTIANGGVINPNIHYIEPGKMGGGISELQKYGYIDKDTLATKLPTDVQDAYLRGMAFIANNPDTSRFFELMSDENTGYYITIYCEDYYYRSMSDHTTKWSINIALFDKSNFPYIGTSFTQIAYPGVTNDSAGSGIYQTYGMMEDWGGVPYIEESSDKWYALPGYTSWIKYTLHPREMTESESKEYRNGVKTLYQIPGYWFSELYDKDYYSSMPYGAGFYSNNDYSHLRVYQGGKGNITYTHEVNKYDDKTVYDNERAFVDDPNVSIKFKGLSLDNKQPYKLIENYYGYSLPYTYYCFDNFSLQDGTLPEIAETEKKPNYNNRINATNKDLVGQLGMTTKEWGRYGTEGKIGDTIYAVFNPVAGDSSSKDDEKNADKITNGEITKDQDEKLDDDTSDANDDTQSGDKAGETTGTSDDKGIIPHIPPTFIAKRSMFNLYQVNETTVRSITDYLWSTDLTNTLLKLYSDPMDAILSMYVLPVASTHLQASTDVMLGNVKLNVKSSLVEAYQETYIAGVIDVTHYNHDVRDYAPYSEYYLYLPYIGIVQLNAEDVVGSKLTIYYDVDLCTGSILARIWVERGQLNACLYQYTGSCIYILPITKLNQQNAITVASNAALNAISGSLTGGVMRAGAQAVEAGISGLQSHVSQGGSIGGNASITASPYPYIIIKHKTPQTPSGSNKYYGKPTLKTITLGKHKGFVRVKDINLSNIDLTKPEIDELETMLKEGVII